MPAKKRRRKTGRAATAAERRFTSDTFAAITVGAALASRGQFEAATRHFKQAHALSADHNEPLQHAVALLIESAKRGRG